MKNVIAVLFLTLAWCGFSQANADISVETGLEQYKSFLYGEYQSDRPNVLIFKDPFCPYCIRAIDKLDTLSAYNVFIFWAPILGDRSVARVNDIFHCTAYASQTVLDAIKQRVSPQCNGPIDEKALALSLQWADNYHISAVPSYFIEGKPTSYVTLLRQADEKPSINGIKVDWKRFAIMQHQPSTQSRYLSLRVPAERITELDTLLSQYQPQYVFLPPDYVAKHPTLLNCDNAEADCVKANQKLYARRAGEFDLLFEGTITPDRLLVFDYQGRVYKPAQ